MFLKVVGLYNDNNTDITLCFATHPTQFDKKIKLHGMIGFMIFVDNQIT